MGKYFIVIIVINLELVLLFIYIFSPIIGIKRYSVPHFIIYLLLRLQPKLNKVNIYNATKGSISGSNNFRTIRHIK